MNSAGPIRAFIVPYARNGKTLCVVLCGDADPARDYVGITGNVPDKLEWHNAGPSGHTISHRPWSVVVSLEFADERTAIRFERYLKSGSGRAVARRHFARDE